MFHNACKFEVDKQSGQFRRRHFSRGKQFFEMFFAVVQRFGNGGFRNAKLYWLFFLTHVGYSLMVEYILGRQSKRVRH